MTKNRTCDILIVEVKRNMPKRKTLPKVPDYEGIGKYPDKAYIQKSRPLQSLSETDLTLPELKILDAYLARIDSHNSKKRTVKFEKGELERYLGVSRILQEDLKKRLRHLFQVVEVKDDNKRNGFKLINLFEEAEAEQDEDGLWQIILTCTPSAKEYIFNIDNIGYLRYRLKNVVNLTSRYSYILFLYLLDNRFRKTWKVKLKDLKILLNCTADRYKQFKFFNAEILKKSQKEIHDKTDIEFSYTPIKTGRSVSHIEFAVNAIADLADTQQGEQLEGQLSLLDVEEQLEELDEESIGLKLYGSELAYFIGGIACKNEFTVEQVQVIKDLVIKIIPQNDVMERCNYVISQMNIMNAYDKQKDPIKNRFNYLRKMLEKELKGD